MDEEQLIQLQDSLADLQDLAAKIESGEVQRDDVMWRLQSYFHVVGVVLREWGSVPGKGETMGKAVGLLESVQGHVSDLVLGLSVREFPTVDEVMDSSVLPSRPQSSTLQASIIPFPSRLVTDSDENW